MALFDEMEAETEAERKRKERERRAAAANGRGNGANAVTSASLGLDGDDPDAEPDVPPVSQTDSTSDDSNAVAATNTFFSKFAQSNPEEAYKMYEGVLSGDASDEVKNAYREQAPPEFADRYNTGLSQAASADLAASYENRGAPTTVDRYGHLPEEDQNAISAAKTHWLPRLDSDPEKAYENYKITMGRTDVSDSVKQFWRDNAPAEFATRLNNEKSRSAQADLAAGYEGRILDKYFTETETQPLYFENEIREAMKDPSSDEAYRLWQIQYDRPGISDEERQRYADLFPAFASEYAREGSIPLSEKEDWEGETNRRRRVSRPGEETFEFENTNPFVEAENLDDVFKIGDAISEGSDRVAEDPLLFTKVKDGIDQGNLNQYNRQFIERNVNFSPEQKAQLLELWDSKDAEAQADVDAAKGPTTEDTYKNLLQQIRSGYLTDRTAIIRAGLPLQMQDDLLSALTQKTTKGADFDVDTYDDFFQTADAVNQGSDVLTFDPHHYGDVQRTIESGDLDKFNREFISRDVNLTEEQREALLSLYDLKVEERRGWQEDKTPEEIYSDFESRIASGEAIDRTEIVDSLLSDEQKTALLAASSGRQREIRSNRAYQTMEGRFLHDSNKPTEHDILTNGDLTQEQKDNLIARYFPVEEVPDEVEEVEGADELSPRDRYGQKYRATVDFLNSGGDPAMVNWNELQSLADAAGVGDLLNKQTLIESGAAEYDKSQRPARQQKAYNDLIGRFMSGANVSEYEIGTADLSDDQRRDLQSRFAEQERRREDQRRREEQDREREEQDRLRREEYERTIEEKRLEAERLRIEAEQSKTANPTIDNEDKAERSSAYDNLSSQIYTALDEGNTNTSQLLYQIETSGLADDEKARLKAMLPKPPPSLDQQAEEQLEQEAETKREEEYVALDEGKTIIETDALVDIIDDVMSNMAGVLSEEDIVKLVSARLQGQNLFVDSATLLNTVADVNKYYYKHFEGTRTRPLTFVERKDMEAKERSDAVVTAAEMDASKTKDDLFAKFGISYEMQSKPEEAYWKAVKLGNASPSEAYRIFKLAGGMGAPPVGQNPNLTPEGREEEDDDSISLFTITEEHGGYGHPFYADDVYNLKAKPGESEEEFWDRVQNAEWLTELKDPDTSASYTKLSPAESDSIVEQMITTLGQNGADSVTLTNALDGLTRFQNSDEFTKNDLRGQFEDALLDALNSMGGEDLDEQKRLLRASAKEDYQDALEEANRYFLVNGLSGSGQEQRRFEELSSNHLKGLREIDMAINEKRNEYAAKQVTLLTDSLSQLANIDVSENKLGLEADDLEERGRQFDASLKQSKYQTEQELNIRNKELNMDETKFYETVRQFNKELGNRINEFAAQFGLNELETAASIRKVNTDIVNQTRELSNQIAMSWADITGIAGDMTGTINLNDLGIPAAEFSEQDRNLPPEYLAQTKIGKAIADSFSAMTGQQITLDQLKAIADGEDLTVEGMPTLESRQIATAITMQNLDRMNKYAAIADENDLELERFETAKEQADRQWYLTIGDVSETFGLNNDAFRDAKYQYDKMFDPLSADPDKNGTNNPDLIHAATEKAREIYLSSSGVAFGDDDYDRINQEFQERWSQANDVFDNTHANQLKDIARQNKFEEDKFERANRQASLQENKYEEVWGALMGARDKDPTSINLYDSNRTLWNETLDYINQYTDAGTTMTPEMAERYRQLVGQPIDPKMTELMAKYENVDMTVDQINSMVEDWSKLSPENKKRDDENEMQYRIRASAAMQTHHQTVDAVSMVARMDRGELRVMDADNINSIVASLMENPPPGLFENINSNYGILNNEAKREVLTSMVSLTVQSREMEQYRDPETGEAIISASDLGLDWYDASGNLKDPDSEWFNDDIRGSESEASIFARFIEDAQRGGDLEGVSVIDLLNDPEYKNWVDDKDKFQMTQHGKNMFKELAGQFNEKFGRNPTVLEALMFKESGGQLNLMSDDPSVGFTTSMNIRLIPENWIDNYNEPGQLEGIFALLNGGNVTPERAVARTSGWAKFGNIAGNIVASGVGAFATASGANLGGGTPPDGGGGLGIW